MRSANTKLFDGVEMAQDQVSAAMGMEFMEHIALVAKWIDSALEAKTFDPPDVASAGDSIGIAAHAFVAALPVQLTTTGTLPAPLALATTYYVLVVDANFIQLEASVGGGVIDLTDAGTGTHTITPVVNAPAFEVGAVSLSADEIFIAGHAFLEDMEVQLTTTDTLPAGLSLATDYYVIVIDADRIKLEASLGGGAINITDQGTGTHTITPVSNVKVIENADVDATANDFTETAHEFVEGEPVQLTTSDTLPDPLALATTYYIKRTDANTFQLETTPGGGAIDITDQGTGDHTVTRFTAADDMEFAHPLADEIIIPAHVFVDEEVVRLTTTGTLPTGLSLATDYYIIFVDADSFQLEASVGGGVIDITADGSGTHTITRTTAADNMEDVAPVAEQINIPAHGFIAELIVQLTTGTTLPAGLSGGTDYWVIVDDANTIRLASSRANARTGTAVNITNGGTGTHTATPTALSATLKLQYAAAKEPVEADWVDSGLSIAIDNDPLIAALAASDVGYRHVRMNIATAGGSGSLTVDINAKGF